jgi:hypothetical protein
MKAPLAWWVLTIQALMLMLIPASVCAFSDAQRAAAKAAYCRQVQMGRDTGLIGKDPDPVDRVLIATSWELASKMHISDADALELTNEMIASEPLGPGFVHYVQCENEDGQSHPARFESK